MIHKEARKYPSPVTILRIKILQYGRHLVILEIVIAHVSLVNDDTENKLQFP